MDETLRAELVDILARAKEAFKEEDRQTLAEISDEAIQRAAIFQEEDDITIAVVTYALSKMLARNEVSPVSWWKEFFRKTQHDLEQARIKVEEGKDEDYRTIIKTIIFHIEKTDTQMQAYIEQVFREAQIKKGSGMFEEGLSLERTAETLGITLWELMNYVGKTKIIDRSEMPEKMQKKIDIARSLFK